MRTPQVVPAAQRILERLRFQPRMSRAQVAAAAITLLEGDRQGAGWRAAEACADPRMRFLLAAVAATVHEGEGWARLAALGKDLPASSRPMVLCCAEPFLSWVDRARGERLAAELLGTENRSGTRTMPPGPSRTRSRWRHMCRGE